MTSSPRHSFGDGFSVSRVINGLWQVADLERDGRAFDIDQAALAMRPYADAGLTTFDMADHYGSAEEIAGIFGERAERLTKWTPRPGPVSREDARDAVAKSLRRLRTDSLDLLGPRRPGRGPDVGLLPGPQRSAACLWNPARGVSDPGLDRQG